MFDVHDHGSCQSINLDIIVCTISRTTTGSRRLSDTGASGQIASTIVTALSESC